MQVGAYFEQPSTTATDDIPHVLSYATARSTTGHRLLDIWNGPTSASRVFSIDKDGNGSASGNLSIAAAKRLYLDGGSNTYIQESVADTIVFVAGASQHVSITSTSLNVGGNLLLSATKLLYLDGGGDTYLHEQSANLLQIVVGGTAFAEVGQSALFKITNSHLSIPAANKLHLDGGGDTYWIESSANVIKGFAAGNEVLQLTAPATNATSLSLRVDRGGVVTAGNALKIGATGTGPGGTGRAVYVDD